MQINKTNTKPFDIEFFNEVTGGDRQFQKEIVETFNSSVKKQLQAIERVAKSEECTQYEWLRVLHSLSGSCNSIGIMKLSSYILNIQNKKEKLTQEERGVVYEEIVILLDKVKDIIAYYK